MYYTWYVCYTHYTVLILSFLLSRSYYHILSFTHIIMLVVSYYLSLPYEWNVQYDMYHMYRMYRIHVPYVPYVLYVPYVPCTICTVCIVCAVFTVLYCTELYCICYIVCIICTYIHGSRLVSAPRLVKHILFGEGQLAGGHSTISTLAWISLYLQPNSTLGLQKHWFYLCFQWFDVQSL